jgi:prepilin-type N-terminal cleavage/methylation domain-containing protein
MRTRKVDERGFTLLELMMVVVIISVMAALAVPQMSRWFSKKDLDGAARELFTTMQQTRLEAIKRNEEIRITFTTSSPYTYTVRTQVTGITLTTKTLPAHMTFDAANFTSALGLGSTITGYSSRGLALQSGSIDIVSSDAPASSNTRTITVTVGGNATITP